MVAPKISVPLFVVSVAAVLSVVPDVTGANLLPALLTIAGALMVCERLMPGAPAPSVRGWYLRAGLLNLCQVGVVVLAGFTWNRWFRGGALFHVAALSDFSAVTLTYLVSTFLFYWWHRWRHESEFWWRLAHQIHHSASRLEVLTSFYKHPVEIVLNSILSAILVYPVMGCSPRQGALYTVVIALGEMFYHWNVRTPRWLGYWFQRPESHRLHHLRERHTKNYGDLPLWDKLFGTFSNPDRADRVACGFSGRREQRLSAMLRGAAVDVARDSEPMKLGPICLGCSKRHRCAKVRGDVVS